MTDEADAMNNNTDVAEEVQDNQREQQMRVLLGLKKSNQGRSGADAIDEEGKEFELKSTTKTSVSTARDVGLHTLDKWRRRYWVFAKEQNLQRSGFVIEQLYFLNPPRLEEWFKSLENKIKQDLNLLERLIADVSNSSLTKLDIDRLRYLVERGATLNNPHIPWQYIQSRGVNLDVHDAPADQLRVLLKTNPLS